VKSPITPVAAQCDRYGCVRTKSYALVVTFEGKVIRYQKGRLTLIGQPVTAGLRLVAWKPDGSTR